MNLKLSAILSALSITQTHAGRSDYETAFCNLDGDYFCIGNDEYQHDSDDIKPCNDWCNYSDDWKPTIQERDDWCNDSDDWKWNSWVNGEPNPHTRPHGRRLDELDVFASISSSCVDKFYKILIKTIGEYGHIGVLAEPSCKDEDNIDACVDCPSYVFHANLDAEYPDMLQKIVEEVVVVVDDKENVKPDIYHEIKYLYALQELLDAFKDVELDDNKSYNLMFNNCGTFLIKMAHNLGIDPTDPAIINSVATMLSPTTKVGAVIGGSEYMARFIGNYVHAN